MIRPVVRFVTQTAPAVLREVMEESGHAILLASMGTEPAVQRMVLKSRQKLAQDAQARINARNSGDDPGGCAASDARRVARYEQALKLVSPWAIMAAGVTRVGATPKGTYASGLNNG